MILVLDPKAPQEMVDSVVRIVTQLGWKTEVSRGDDQTVIGLSGDGDPEALDKALAERGDIDIVPILTRQQYQRLRIRRRMMTGLVGGLGLLTAMGAAAPVAGFLLPPKGMLGERDLVKVGTAQEMGERASKPITLFGRTMLLIRGANGRFYATSAICTHMSVCHLEWKEERNLLVCPCHGGEFDVYGNVVKGPPSVPLQTFPVEVSGDDLLLRREV
ncbi:MAG: Rieske 2Fe-2S domain-containing protein [Planctomycetota bacterium]|nr:Rieske 2Fe-2S domain-containing protein [Planctomycetota bacterium]